MNRKGKGDEKKRNKKDGKSSLDLDERWKLVETGWELSQKENWNADKWRMNFKNADGYFEHRMLRVQVAVHTVKHSLNFMDEMIKARERVTYYDTPTTLPGAPAHEIETITEVWDGDCLVAGLTLQDKGYNPVVLNMANQVIPGGGWLKGSGAQEENIFRRTAYWASLQEDSRDISSTLPALRRFDFSYPMSDEGTIYSPDVLVFRGTEQCGYPYLETPQRMSFIACAAYRKPPCGPSPGFRYLNNDHEEGMFRKICGILATALHHGHDSIVLSAFGCGAFCNPPNIVAELFERALRSEHFVNRFRIVVFAIFNDHNSAGPVNPFGNVIPFENVFGSATYIK